MASTLPLNQDSSKHHHTPLGNGSRYEVKANEWKVKISYVISLLCLSAVKSKSSRTPRLAMVYREDANLRLQGSEPKIEGYER